MNLEIALQPFKFHGIKSVPIEFLAKIFRTNKGAPTKGKKNDVV